MDIFFSYYSVYYTEESIENHIDDFIVETRHSIKTLSKQKVKAFFLSTLIALKRKWVPRFSELESRFFDLSNLLVKNN